ncbi:MAG: hypothetical protein GX146_04770 [Myxococcales bacterium]|jgi:hypothetical protein|nr:hypothetical protein [Myxococcales bacterium]
MRKGVQGYWVLGLVCFMGLWGCDDGAASSSVDGVGVLGAGGWHTCGVRLDTGEALCWGYNYSGQSDPPVGVSFGKAKRTHAFSF